MSDARAWLARGNAHARDGQSAAAAEAYREVLQREPGWNDARFNLGLMQKQLGDRAAAVRAFHAAWTGDPLLFDAARQCVATIAESVRAGDRNEGAPLPALRSAEAPDLAVSVVICSIDDARHDRAVALYRRLFAAVRHEIVSIRNARSLAEAYNWALRRCVADVIILSHDDVDVLAPDFAARLFERLQAFDVIGVAGSTRMECPAIGWSGHPHLRGWITHHRQGEAAWQVDVLDPRPVAGVDWSYRAAQAGFKLGVAGDLLLVHASRGNYDATWQHYADRFCRKHGTGRSPARPSSFFGATLDDAQQVRSFFALLESLDRPA